MQPKLRFDVLDMLFTVNVTNKYEKFTHILN